ncbi:MAG: histidine kinase [Chitinophagaceae bacterium]|nr:histidine kinase [Chitinophagaceae bacterium]
MMRLSVYLIAFFLISGNPLAAQYFAENKFTNYTTADGLSDNTITGIAQDGAGYIWLPTASGLNRYDGTRFVQYHSTGDSLSPASEEFFGLKWLDKERLAFYTAGIHIINTRTGHTNNLFIPYPDRKYQSKFNLLPEMLGDEQGNIFILNRSGFYHFDKQQKLAYRFDYYTADQVPLAYFAFGRELVELDDQHLLITAIDGLYIYARREKKLTKLKAGDYPLLDGFLDYPTTFYRFFQAKRGSMVVTKMNSDSIFHINIPGNRKTISKVPFVFTKDEVHWRSRLAAANDSVFYITGHISGFYKMQLNQQTGAIRIFPEKYFKTSLCYGLLTDRDNNLWVATNKGLFKQDDIRSKVQVAHLPEGLESSFPNIRISAIYASEQKVYAGNNSKAGLLVFDKRTFQFEEQVLFKNYERSHGVNSVFRISSVSPSVLFLGTNGALFLYHEKNGTLTALKPEGWSDGDWVNDLYRDSQNNLWISSINLYQYDLLKQKFTLVPQTKPIPAIPVAIREDNAGNIWVAGHGITRYNISQNRFDLKIDSFPFIKMPDRQVTAMEIDKGNTIWFGSANNGLVSYNIEKKSFRHFTRSNGLPDDNIGSMLIIGNKLWMSCYSGLASMDLETLQIKSFGKEEGFPDMPVMKGSNLFYDSTERQLYVGFFNAAVRFDPSGILMPGKQPAVFIENLKIGGNKNVFLPGDKITTSWKQNDLMITIGSINFTDGRNQHYAYRVVKNSDSPWQLLGSQQSFSISNLSPGIHRIQVKIFSVHNRWHEQVNEITVEVFPPYWQKAWFRALALLLAMKFVFLVIQWRTQLARKKEMQKTQMEKLKAEDYKNRYELEQITHYFSSSLAGKKTAEEVLWDVAGNLIGQMNYEDCMIYLWNEDKTKMVQKAAYGPKGDPEIISSQLFDVIPGQGVVGHVMQTLQPVLIQDTREDGRYRVDEAFRLSEVCVPVIHNGELLGIIDSEHHKAGYFTERDIKVLTTIATLIGNKLKQLESEQILEVKQRELANINAQLAEAKLSALQAQMNPHFIFNALNSIKRMILDGDNEKASRYLSRFALMIRMTLNHSKEAFVTLAENIEYLKAYLGMEQLRFDGSFNWTISVAADIDPEETGIPSLMIQPLVENAIWHGLLQSENDKKLAVSFTRSENKITCIIEDNGIGIRQSQRIKEQNKGNHRSVGLDNLRNRIKILNEKYKVACRLVITDLGDVPGNEQGTRATLEFEISNG